ncbi:hypothetical protein PENSPDRAFT_672097, partial [Peniophora sp. CONT]
MRSACTARPHEPTVTQIINIFRALPVRAEHRDEGTRFTELPFWRARRYNARTAKRPGANYPHRASPTAGTPVTHIEINDDHRSAYSLALELGEPKRWPAALPADKIDKISKKKAWPTGKLTPQMASRILGYILIEAPVQQGADNIANEINSCSAEEDARGSIETLYNLADLARFYSLTLLKTFYKYSGKTPILPEHPSRLSFALQRKDVEDNMQQSEADYIKSKEKALARDGHRCVLQGIFDTAYYESLSLSDRRPCRIEETNAAHIIPHKLSTNHDKPDK